MTTTLASTQRSLRFPAGVLIFAATVTLGQSVMAVVASALSFSSSSQLLITYQLAENEATRLPGPGFGYFTEAIATTPTVSFWPQFWIALGTALWGVVRFVLALCVLRFALAAYRGEVFTPRLPALLLTSAVALGVGGSLASLFVSGGHDNAAAEIGFVAPDSPLAYAKDSPDLLWPILGALLLGLLAAVFRAGFRFKRDTEGLV